MSLANIKLNSAVRRGFTIVELLIVVVVIAILAAITIVSYNGITTRANASAAKSTAATWQKKIELYQAEVGGYPANFAAMQTGGSDKPYYVEPGNSAKLGTPTSTNGKDTVNIVSCGTNAGVVITYFDYEAAETADINVGDTTTCTSTPWS